MKESQRNPLRKQCLSLEELAPIQFARSFRSAQKIISEELVHRIRRIIITGCGDSYFAARECRDAFRIYLPECRLETVSAMEAARFLPLREAEPETMLIAVSAGGNTARIAEILERGKKHACMTVALTNHAESRAAKSAELVYETNTPVFPDDSPGLRSYYASLLSLIVLASYMGEIRAGKEFLMDLREALLTYNAIFFHKVSEMDGSCRNQAECWQKKKGFEVVADGPLFSCGEFVAAKYAEAAGAKCTVVDSENYCHVNGLMYPAWEIGTIVMACREGKNWSRVRKTMERQKKDGRDIFLTCFQNNGVSGKDEPASDGQENRGKMDQMMDGINLCSVPAPDEKNGFLLPLYSFIPGALLAAYHAELNCETYFRGDERFFAPGHLTIDENAWCVL